MNVSPTVVVSNVVKVESPANETSSTKLEVGGHNHVMLMILLSLLAVAIVVLGISITAWLLKRNRTMQLRHHLMPMYNFEPSDSGGDWETDLLGHHDNKLRTDSESPVESPVLKLNALPH